VAEVAPTHAHAVRGALLLQSRVGWLTEPHALDLLRSSADLGTLPLAPVQFPGAFASSLRCGERSITIGYIGDQLRLTDGEQVFDMVAATGAPGHRFELAGDPTTFVQLGEQTALVSVRGRDYERCIAARPSR
jgi:hypothetical protein